MSWAWFHSVEFTLQGAIRLLALAAGVRPVRTGTALARQSHQRIARLEGADGDLHEWFSCGDKKQNGPGR